jgi:hypothetical protein
MLLLESKSPSRRANGFQLSSAYGKALSSCHYRFATSAEPFHLEGVATASRSILRPCLHLRLRLWRYLRTIERSHGLLIKRIAIDAPSCYKLDGIARRAAEVAMDKLNISCFATPSQTEFNAIRARANTHLNDGLPENRMPHANQLWMLVGFALFDILKRHYDCIEVFPQAIAHALQARTLHKSKREGCSVQLSAVAKHSRWPTSGHEGELHHIAFGSLHDKLEAYMSAWVASLSDQDCSACGAAPSDVIWIPRLGSRST